MSGFVVVKLRWPRSVPLDQISEKFLQGMLDRMAMGFHTYGHVMRDENVPDALASLDVRLKKYRVTGNTEFLMDCANFCMMEFMRPSVEDAYFEPTTKRESPGAVLLDKRRVKGKEDY